jgi:hypothetical protein
MTATLTPEQLEVLANAMDILGSGASYDMSDLENLSIILKLEVSSTDQKRLLQDADILDFLGIYPDDGDVVPETLQIKALQRGVIRLRLIGTEPLFMNRMSAKAKQVLLVGSKKKTTAEKANIKHDPMREFVDAMDRNMGDGPTALLQRIDYVVLENMINDLLPAADLVAVAE